MEQINLTDQSDENVLRELSELSTHALLSEIINTAHLSGHDTIIPGFSLMSTDLIADLHTRLQLVQQVEQFHPKNIENKITLGLTSRFIDSKSTVPLTLDAQVNRIGASILNGDTLKEFKLDRTEQLLFLRSVILAMSGRFYEAEHGGRAFSDKQRKIQARAIAQINQFASNPVHVPIKTDQESLNRFASAYSAAYLASIVQRETNEEHGSGHMTTSVSDAMYLPIAFGRLQSGDQSEVLSVFPPGHTERILDGGKEFVPKPPSQLDDQRIRDLRALQDTFGDERTIFRYYETEEPILTGRGGKGGDGGSGDKTPELKTERNDEDVDDNYIVLEIEQVEDTRRRQHIVAENPKINNACFSLREEVIDEWETLIGVRLSWRDIFSLNRKSAEQMGARRFCHTVNTNVPQNVRKYLLQDPQSMILETFGKIFDRKDKQLFDDTMQPTVDNQMPVMLLHYIANSALLRTFWSDIRTYGYQETTRILRGQERAIRNPRTRTHRIVTVRDRAASLWSTIASEQAKVFSDF